MAFKPNEEQQLFISTKDKNVLVSASAGSGKTTTMVHKLVDIICNDKVHISELLIVTYTNAAANEMKQKIYNALLAKLREVDEESQEFLYQELESINVSDIGTLHSVCKKILAKYFYKLNQNPSFSLILDKEQEYIFASTIDKVVKRRILNINDKFYHLYENFSQKRNMNAMYSVISRIYTFLITKPDYKACVKDMFQVCYTDISNNICAKFNPSLPVTRYFKDTVRFLEKISDGGKAGTKKGSKRRFATIWRLGDYDENSKEECLFSHIQDILNQDSEHHFVVFATKQQALNLGKYFREKGYREHNSNHLDKSA